MDVHLPLLSGIRVKNDLHNPYELYFLVKMNVPKQLLATHRNVQKNRRPFTTYTNNSFPPHAPQPSCSEVKRDRYPIVRRVRPPSVAQQTKSRPHRAHVCCGKVQPRTAQPPPTQKRLEPSAAPAAWCSAAAAGLGRSGAFLLGNRGEKRGESANSEENIGQGCVV